MPNPRYTVHQRTVGTESRTIGHTGGDLLTYRVDGLLPRCLAFTFVYS